jgi:hypothetical protein
MPRKTKWSDNPLVPVRGNRVRAALAWRGLSNREAAARLKKRGVDLTAQGLDYITAGETRRCRRSVRSELARLCGPPITAAYLGGEENLDLPPLPLSRYALKVPSAPADMLGSKVPGHPEPINPQRVRQSPAVSPPPRYELEAIRLAKLIAKAWERDREKEEEVPNVLNEVRFLLSLPFWRKWIYEMGDLGAEFPSLKTRALELESIETESDAFAAALARALTILLRPWLQGKVMARRWLLRGALASLWDALDSATLLYWADVKDSVDKGTWRFRELPDGDYLLKRVAPSTHRVRAKQQ